METQFVSGIVQKFFTLGEDQLVLMQRKTKDTQFVCRFGKGEHRSLVEGEDKKFDGMVKATDPYKEFDTYDFVGVQARGSDEVYVKSEKTSDGAEVRTEVTEKIPEKIGFELSPNVIGEIMGGAMNMLAYSAISNQIDTTEEMTKVAKGMTMVMIEAVDDIYKKYNK